MIHGACSCTAEYRLRRSLVFVCVLNLSLPSASLILILSQIYQHDLGQQALFQRELENLALANSYEHDRDVLLQHFQEVQEENEQLKQAMQQHDQLLQMRQEGTKHDSNTTTSSPQFYEQPCDETTLSTLLEQGEQALSAGKSLFSFIQNKKRTSTEARCCCVYHCLKS